MGQDHMMSETGLTGPVRQGALRLEGLLTRCLKFGLTIVFLIFNKDDR